MWRSSTQPHKRTRAFKVKEKRYEFLSSAGYTLDFQVFICYSNYILCVLIDEVSNTLTNLPNYTPVRAPDYLQTDGSVGLIVVCVFTPTDRLNGLLSVAPGREANWNLLEAWRRSSSGGGTGDNQRWPPAHGDIFLL